MNLKKYLNILITLCLSVVVVGCQKQAETTKPEQAEYKLDTQQKRMSYVIGREIANSASGKGEPLDAEALAEGIRDAQNHLISQPDSEGNGSLIYGESDIENLTTYAVALGRALGCGHDIKSQSIDVSVWVAKKFGSDQGLYAEILKQGVTYHKNQQESGKSPDDCNVVKENYSNISWPK